MKKYELPIYHRRQSVAILDFLICITDKNSIFIQIYKEILRIAKEIWKK